MTGAAGELKERHEVICHNHYACDDCRLLVENISCYGKRKKTATLNGLYLDCFLLLLQPSVILVF